MSIFAENYALLQSLSENIYMFEVKLCFSKCFASTPAPYVREWRRFTGTCTAKPEKRFFHARKEGGRWNFFTGKNGRGMILQCTAKTFFRPVKKLVKLVNFPINFAHSLMISCKIIIFASLFHYDACYELNHVFLFYSQTWLHSAIFLPIKLWAPWQNFLAILNVKVLKHA